VQVTAISTPRYPEWRWRITDYAGETVENPTSASQHRGGGGRGDGADDELERGRSLGRGDAAVARPRRAEMTCIV